MKQVLTIPALQKVCLQLIVSVGFFAALLTPRDLFAQEDSAQNKKPATEEVSSLISPSVEFISVQKANNTIDLKAALKAKVKGSLTKLPLLRVTFFQVTDSAEKELGFDISDRNGMAVLNIKTDSLLPAGKEGKLNFKAVYAGNKSLEAAEESITIKRARLQITPVKEDSVLTVQLKLVDVGTGVEIPVPEAELGVFVARSFSPLKIGEGTTDENGDASVEIPGNLPGDAKGNITLLARLDENELYGSLEASVVQQWGIPVSDKPQKLPRALWSPHPPLWMLVTFIILMTAVWGHYIVIIYELFRLRKEEPHAPVNATNS